MRKRLRPLKHLLPGDRGSAFGVLEAVAVTWPLWITIAVILAFFYIFVFTKEVARLAQLTAWNMKLIYACHAHDIRRCDDANVTEGNKQNPERAITVDWLRASD